MKSFVFEDEKFAYSEETDDRGYFYRVCVKWNRDAIELLIGSHGVVLDYFDKNYFIHTNIVPEKMFGEQYSLTKEQICKIVSVIKSTDGEGKKYDRRLLFGERK